MKEDYLWDGSGEPDAEIEHLEQVLARYRHTRSAPAIPARRALPQSWFAVAAALLLALFVGIWTISPRETVTPVDYASIGTGPTVPDDPGSSPLYELPNPDIGTRDSASVETTKIGTSPAKRPRPVIQPIDIENEDTDAWDLDWRMEIAVLDPDLPRESLEETDSATVIHIEQAKLLLRSVRNLRPLNGRTAIDVTYEKARSKTLLYQNILLRRNAAARGDHMVEDLLSEVEPYLLEISNLPDRPSLKELADIRIRIHRTEIVATLQIHSANAVLGGDW